MQYDVTIIGGGPAGVTAALRARELGATVALIERRRLGGTCTYDGCVPTRVLAKAARLMRDAEQDSVYGLFAERPIVDFRRVLTRAQQVVYELQEKKQLVAHLANVGATVFEEAGGASFIDSHTVAISQQRTIESDKFILCTGGSARRLSFPGSEYTLTHGDVWSMETRPHSMVIVGGGATGCQLASIFNAFGTKVTLLDVAPRLLITEDALVSQVIAERFRLHGIQVITGIDGLSRVEQRDGLHDLIYTQDGVTHSLPVECVILSVGWSGNIGDLNPGAAGVNTNRYFVEVDDYLQTSVPNIFAAGDVTGKMMLVQSATDQARIAAENAVSGRLRKAEYQLVPHGGFTDPEYGSVGYTEQQALERGDVIVAVVPYADMDRAVIDGRTAGFCKLIVDRSTRRVLGAHVVGELALEVVQLVAAGMAAGLLVEQLAELEIAYPTFAAIVGLAARQIVRDLGIVPVVPEWRELRKSRAAEWERRSDT